MGLEHGSAFVVHQLTPNFSGDTDSRAQTCTDCGEFEIHLHIAIQTTEFPQSIASDRLMESTFSGSLRPVNNRRTAVTQFEAAGTIAQPFFPCTITIEGQTALQSRTIANDGQIYGDFERSKD